MLVEAFVPGLQDRPISMLYGRSRASDRALSDAIHESSGRRPWTACQEGGGMRLTFLEDAPREAVLCGLTLPVEIRAAESYASLVAGARPYERFTLRFLTPTCPGHRHTDRRRPDRQQDRANLLPDAGRVFGSVAGRWAGPPLPEIDYTRVWADWVSLKTVSVALQRRQYFRGVVGTVAYTCPTLSEEERFALGALCLFARFCGVGSRTGYGMGRVEVDGRLEGWRAGVQPATVASAAG